MPLNAQERLAKKPGSMRILIGSGRTIPTFSIRRLDVPNRCLPGEDSLARRFDGLSLETRAKPLTRHQGSTIRQWRWISDKMIEGRKLCGRLGREVTIQNSALELEAEVSGHQYASHARQRRTGAAYQGDRLCRA